VFADLGLENPVEPLARAALVQSICDIIAERKLTQARAAMLLGIDQPRVAPPNSLDSELSVCHNRHIMSTGVNEDSRPLYWMGSSRADVREFPFDVRQAVGFALWQAQLGRKHRDAKVLKGFGGAGVLELVKDHDGNTFRAVYTVRFAGAIYVLHAFQKKSKTGIKTPKAETELIRRRLKAAEKNHEQRTAEEERRRSDQH
jgi:phage-related protein